MADILPFTNSNLGSVTVSIDSGMTVVRFKFGAHGDSRSFVMNAAAQRHLMALVREAAAYGVRIVYSNGLIVNKTTLIDIPGADEVKHSLVKFLHEHGKEIEHGPTSFTHSVRG